MVSINVIGVVEI